MVGRLGQEGKSHVLVALTLLAVVTLTAVWLRQKDVAPKPVIEAGSPTVAPAGLPKSDINDIPPGKSADTQVRKVPAEAPVIDPKLQEWLSVEARELDNPRVDGAAKQRKIREIVKKMTPPQSRQLLNTVKNPKASAGEKILSTYLLVEGGPRTQEELTELITSPLQEKSDYAPHTVDEMKGIREKSLRIMAIDGLFSKARNEPSARAALARAARETSDPTVRAYAEDKLRQLRQQSL